jgi:uncharacterized protein YdcH (DUF465 family)
MIKKEALPSSIEVLIEHFDAKFNLLIDGYTALDKKIDDFRAEVKERFRLVDERFKMIEEYLARHDAQFEVIFEELHNIRGEIAVLKV